MFEATMRISTTGLSRDFSVPSKASWNLDRSFFEHVRLMTDGRVSVTEARRRWLKFGVIEFTCFSSDIRGQETVSRYRYEMIRKDAPATGESVWQ